MKLLKSPPVRTGERQWRRTAVEILDWMRTEAEEAYLRELGEVETRLISRKEEGYGTMSQKTPKSATGSPYLWTEYSKPHRSFSTPDDTLCEDPRRNAPHALHLPHPPSSLANQ